MSNKTTTIIVRFLVKSEKREIFQTALRSLLDGLRQEATFVEARIHRDLDQPDTVVLYETYQERRDSFSQRVSQEPWFQTFVDKLPELLQQEREVFWNERTAVYDKST